MDTSISPNAQCPAESHITSTGPTTAPHLCGLTVLDVFFNEFAKEDGVVGGAFVVPKIDGFLDVGDPLLLWDFFQWPMRAVGQKLLGSWPDWVVPIRWFDDFGCCKFRSHPEG